MTAQPPLLVAGLPYSGAAVPAEALHRAGLPLGGPFLSPRPRDLVGTFVDREIHAWHRRWTAPASLEDSDSVARALVELDVLLAERFQNAAAWGVRSPLALDAAELWERRFAEARWLIVVREPSVQVASYAERLPDETALPRPSRAARVLEGLRAWRAGHGRALDLARRAPERVLVLDAARFAGYDATVDSWLRERCGLPLAPVSVSTALRPFLFRRRAAPWVRWLARLTPGVASRWRELSRLAATAEPPAEPRPGPRTCVAARLRYAPSESFIQEQLRRLPGEVHFLFRREGLWRDRDCRPLVGLGRRLIVAAGRELGFGLESIEERALARFLRRERIDCVVANFGHSAVDLRSACRAAGIPLVAHFHGADAHRERPGVGTAAFYAPVFAEAAAIVAVSQPMIERLVALGAPRERIRLNPCGIDPDEFPAADPGSAPPLFVAAGRFVDKKAPHLTLLAFARALATVPEARLVMLGDGELREACIRLAAALGIADRVELPGAFAHAELPIYLRRARAFLQHSMARSDGDAEGSPVAVVEAAASALPVISTRHAGIPLAVLDGRSGLLVDEGDVDAMATHIVTLAREPQLAAALGRRGREHARGHYSFERRIAHLATIVEAVANARPLPEMDDLAVAAEPLPEQAAALTPRRAQHFEE